MSSTPSAIACAVSIFLAASLVSLSAQSAAEIIEKHEREKADALTAYLDGNAKAEDKVVALEALVGAHRVLGNRAKMLDYMRRHFEAMDKNQAEAKTLFETIEEMTGVISDEEGKAAAKAFYEAAVKSIESHPLAAQLQRALEQQIGASLKQLGVGDVMTIAVKDVNGDEIDLAKMKGKVVLVDFWATWCGPCIAELPTVQAAYKDHHDQGFEIIGISLDHNPSALEEFIANNEMPWRHYFDENGKVAGEYGITAIPSTFLIGKDGKIAAVGLRGEALGEQVAKLLGKEGGA